METTMEVTMGPALITAILGFSLACDVWESHGEESYSIIEIRKLQIADELLRILGLPTGPSERKPV